MKRRSAGWPAAIGLADLVLDRIEDGTTIVEAAIETYPAIPTLINTGGRSTEFSRSALPGHRRWPPSASAAASGPM